MVACKNFVLSCPDDVTLVEFKQIENMFLSSSENRRSPKLENIREIFSSHPFFEDHRQEVSDRYWEQFIVDSIIGNFDRHSENWGYLATVKPGTNIPDRFYSLAPVYDCGSSLAPRLSEEEMKTIASDSKKLRDRALDFPSARLTVGDSKKQVGYYEFLISDPATEAREAVLRLAPKIQALDLCGLIDQIPGISDIRKEFYVKTIESRIEAIVQPAYELACREKGLTPERLVSNTTRYPNISQFKILNEGNYLCWRSGECFVEIKPHENGWATISCIIVDGELKRRTSFAPTIEESYIQNAEYNLTLSDKVKITNPNNLTSPLTSVRELKDNFDGSLLENSKSQYSPDDFNPPRFVDSPTLGERGIGKK